MQKSELQVFLFEMQSVLGHSGASPSCLDSNLKIFFIAWTFFLLGVVVGSQGQKIHTWISDLETTKASVGSF